ncbi:hypothetical protein D3C71_2212690 [compost metagenome]
MLFLTQRDYALILDLFLNFKIKDTAKPNNSPQNAEPIPKNCMPDAQNKKVIKAASRSLTS